MKPHFCNRFRSAALVAASSVMCLYSASAGVLTWDGNGATEPNPDGGVGTWDTATTANWWNGAANVNWPALGGSDDDAVFGDSAGAVTIAAAGVTANELAFNTTGYVVQGGTLTLNGTSPAITTAADVAATINSNLAGSGGMVKSGSGTLVLSGSNGYTGITTIDAGALQIASAGALPTTTTVALTTSGARLTLGVPGQALAWVPGSAVAEAFHANSPTYQAEHAIDGSLTTRWAGGTGHWIYADLGTSQSVGLFKINWEAARSTSFVIQTSDDAASWTNVTGTLSSSAANVWETYSLNPGAAGRYVRMLSAATVFGTGGGDSIWEMQALTAASGAGIYSIGSLSGAAGTVVDLLGIGSTLKAGGDNSDTTFAGYMLGGAADSFVKEGAGTLTWVGTTGYQVAPIVTAGTLKSDLTAGGGELTLPGTNIVVQENGTLQLHSGDNTAADSTFFRNGTITGNGTITKTGAGYLGFLFVSNNGVKDFTGLIDVREGTLANNGTAWAAGAGLMDLNVAAGAQFDLRTQNLKIDALTGGGLIARSWTGTATLSVGNNNGSGTFSGTIQNLRPEGSNGGVLAFTKTGTGTQTLAGTLTYTGATTVDGGRLVLQDTTGFASSGTVVNGGTLELQRTTGTWNISTVLTGAGNIEKTGDGAVTLAGNSAAFAGATQVSAGTLLVTGALGGNVSAGSGATVGGSGDIGGNLTFDTGSTLFVADIADALAIGGSVTFGSGFGLDNLTGWDYATAANGEYTVLLGNVDTTNLDNLGLANAVSFGADRHAYFESGSLKVVVIPEPSTALLVGLGVFGLVRRRRDR